MENVRRVPLLACPAVPSEKESGRFIMPVVNRPKTVDSLGYYRERSHKENRGQSMARFLIHAVIILPCSTAGQASSGTRCCSRHRGILSPPVRFVNISDVPFSAPEGEQYLVSGGSLLKSLPSGTVRYSAGSHEPLTIFSYYRYDVR